MWQWRCLGTICGTSHWDESRRRLEAQAQRHPSSLLRHAFCFFGDCGSPAFVSHRPKKPSRCQAVHGSCACFVFFHFYFILMSLVGFRRNSSLLDIFVIFPGVEKPKGSLARLQLFRAGAAAVPFLGGGGSRGRPG